MIKQENSESSSLEDHVIEAGHAIADGDALPADQIEDRRPDEPTYRYPVSQLLTLADNFSAVDHYRTLELTQDHIPQLIQILNDETLYAMTLDNPSGWGPIHAWRALAELKATDAIPDLIRFLHHLNDHYDEWIVDEFPDVFSLIGPDAITPLVNALEDGSMELLATSCVCESLTKIGIDHPNERIRCIEILTRLLNQFEQWDEVYNGCFICSLLDLEAVESIDVIREAYAHGCVDIDIPWDIEDVEIILGLRAARATPKRLSPFIQRLHDLINVRHSSHQMAISGVKIGRNDLCPCGSGKKYKKCCLH